MAWVCECMCACSSTGTLTAVESFLTVKAGSDVSNYMTHQPLQWKSGCLSMLDHPPFMWQNIFPLISNESCFGLFLVYVLLLSIPVLCPLLLHFFSFCCTFLSSTVRAAVSTMAHGSRLSMVLPTVRLSKVSGGSLTTNPSLLLAQN